MLAQNDDLHTGKTMTTEKKIPDSISIYPSRKSWLEAQADRLTKIEGKQISKSEVFDRIVSIAIAEDWDMAALVLKKARNGSKSIKQLKAES
jgi:hypothetical protein